jgi:hypothetical protein
MNILIINKYKYHYEIIESIILKYNLIINKLLEEVNIYLKINMSNISFIKYIIKKYPKIRLLFYKKKIKYDFVIECTFCGDINKLINDGKHYYISHRVKNSFLKYKNIFYLTPLNNNNYIYADVLPFVEEKKKMDIPVFCIQGSLNSNRRDYSLLINILNKEYEYKYILKMIGYGCLPEELKDYKNKILLKTNLNFLNYHKEFQNVYCIIPLISYKKNSNYYTNQLTSSISYGLGYKLKFLIDKRLQEIYNLNDVYIYNNSDGISEKFKDLLIDFYNN